MTTQKDLVKLSPQERGWMTTALLEVNAGRSLDISLTGAAAQDVARRIHATAAKLPTMDLWKAGAKVLPSVGVLPIPVDMVVPVLAAVGAVGGMIGSVAFIACVAVAHRYEVGFEYQMHGLLDQTDDELVLHLRVTGK